MTEKLQPQEVDQLITQYGLEEYRDKTLNYNRNGETITAPLVDAIALCGLHMFSGFKASGLPDTAVGNIIKTMVDASQ